MHPIFDALDTTACQRNGADPQSQEPPEPRARRTSCETLFAVLLMTLDPVEELASSGKPRAVHTVDLRGLVILPNTSLAQNRLGPPLRPHGPLDQDG